MITVTLGEILSALPAIEILSDFSFKGSIAFEIARLIRELDKEAQLFNQKREELLNRYCEQDINGNIIIENNNARIKNEYIQQYNEELQQMLEIKIDINAAPLSAEILDNIMLSPKQALSLEKFFK